MLGHAPAAMTLDTYADLFDDDLDAVAVGLDTARSSRIVSMSVSMAPKPYAKEPLLPLVSKDVGVLSLAVPVGFETKSGPLSGARYLQNSRNLLCL